MNQFWNERYRVEEYVYGKEANAFLKSKLEKMEPGKILLPGEGEGRNAVYAAKKNWSVSAFDPSSEGQKKAYALAKESGVSIEYTLASYDNFNYPSNEFDVIALFFTHQAAEMRIEFHQKIKSALKPGGFIVMEAFNKNQIRRDSGGPGNVDFLFSNNELRMDFSDMNILELREIIRKLNEGPFHQGDAEVVQLLAQKQN
jgi:ubiquinone/menaquinone biosynthesis C-methylase UbiE